MLKVAIIGAGSFVFANDFIYDLLLCSDIQPALQFHLMDIDPKRLAICFNYAKQLINKLNCKAQVRATLDLKECIKNADYVLNMILVGGKCAVLKDFTIPEKFGIKQTIADSYGIGGISRAIRTIPVLKKIIHNIEVNAPNALLINYSNPMAMNLSAIKKISNIKFVGLCRDVQKTAGKISEYLGIEQKELSYLAAGINHMCWFLRIERKSTSENLYPVLVTKINDKEIYCKDKVRFEILRRFGYFVSESSTHVSEYMPYFLKHNDLISDLDIPIGEYLKRLDYQETIFENSPTKSYFDNDEVLRKSQSNEYGYQIIYALETNSDFSFYGNVINDGYIDNVLKFSPVEIPCNIKTGKIEFSERVTLPCQLAALNNIHLSIVDLTVDGILKKDRDYIYQACYLDPLISSILPFDLIVRMCDELFTAQGYKFNSC